MIREMAMDTMTKFIAAHSTDGNAKNVETLKAMGLDEVRKRFRDTAKSAIERGQVIHKLLCEHLPVYPVS